VIFWDFCRGTKEIVLCQLTYYEVTQLASLANNYVGQIRRRIVIHEEFLDGVTDTSATMYWYTMYQYCKMVRHRF
jgi:hypothetical protein